MRPLRPPQARADWEEGDWHLCPATLPPGASVRHRCGIAPGSGAILRQGLRMADRLEQETTSDSHLRPSVPKHRLPGPPEPVGQTRVVVGMRAFIMGDRQMQWDRIEAEWSEMARRASGNGSRIAAAPAEGVEARPDALPADTAIGTVALNAVDTPDRIMA